MVTHTPLQTEVGGLDPQPYVGKLVVAFLWSEVYSAEP